MYKIEVDEVFATQYYLRVILDGSLIPVDHANRHYQEVLDAIIEQGADCFEGDIPADLQAAADAKQGNN